MHVYPLLVIVTGLLSKSPGGAAEATEIYNICNGSRYNNVRITAASSPFIIRSQEVDVAKYDDNMDCSLVLQSGTQPLKLSFVFSEFNLETSSICKYDLLCLNGVSQFCGSSFRGTRDYYILPGNREFTAHFHTDDSVTMSGFEIFVTTSPLAEGQTVTQPAVRRNYHPGFFFMVTTNHPGIPYSDGCVHYSPRSTTYPPIYPDDDNGISNTTEDPATPTEELEYDFYYLSNSQKPTIYINTSSSPFLILSPNYGSGYYFGSQFSSLVLRSGVQPLVLNMDIKDFQVEIATNCTPYDSLCMGGAKFCGYWLTGYRLQFILPEDSEFTISFRTDQTVPQRGFKIEVSQELATSQVVQQPWNGFVSGIGPMVYTQETYRPGYPYSDRCARSSFTSP